MSLTKTDTKVQKLIVNVGTESDINAAIAAGEIGSNELSVITNKSDCKRNVGEIVKSILPLTDAGLHLLDGSLILGGGIYDEFVQYIAGLVSTYPSCFTTEAAWQQSVTDYGVCGKFVYDSVNNTVRLPKITGIVEGTTDLMALGDLVQAGLPNITATNMSVIAGNSIQTGAVIRNDNKPYVGSSSSATWNYTDLDASLSSSIYGNSTTVQPQTIKVLYYIVIAASIKTDIEVDIDNIATDLNGKADKDLSNVSTGSFENVVAQAQTGGKETVIGWGVPDYNSAIELNISVKSADYTVQNTGYYLMHLSKNTANQSATLRVNGLDVMSISITAAWESTSAVLFLKQGDVVSSSRSYVYAADIRYFVPCSGVN